MNTAGRKIFLARKELNLTQKQLAEKIGQPASVVARWETGRYNPSTKNLEDLSKALGKDYKYFYEDMQEAISTMFSSPAWRSARGVKDGSSRFAPAEAQVLAVVKKGEVIFFDAEAVPGPNGIGTYNINVRDNSLSPEFEETDTLEIQPTGEVEDGKFFLVEIAAEQYIYKCTAEGKNFVLTLNKTKKTLPQSKVKVLGRVISVKKLI